MFGFLCQGGLDFWGHRVWYANWSNAREWPWSHWWAFGFGSWTCPSTHWTHGSLQEISTTIWIGSQRSRPWRGWAFVTSKTSMLSVLVSFLSLLAVARHVVTTCSFLGSWLCCFNPAMWMMNRSPIILTWLVISRELLTPWIGLCGQLLIRWSGLTPRIVRMSLNNCLSLGVAWTLIMKPFGKRLNLTTTLPGCASRKPVVRAMTGRGRQQMPQRRHGQLAPTKTSRPGDRQPAFLGTCIQHAQWLKQLRRLQSYVRLSRSGVATAAHRAHQYGLWTAILRAPGFCPSFPDWWAQRSLAVGEPAFVPLTPPDQNVAWLFYAGLEMDFEQLEKSLRSARSHAHRLAKASDVSAMYRSVQRDASCPGWLPCRCQVCLCFGSRWGRMCRSDRQSCWLESRRPIGSSIRSCLHHSRWRWQSVGWFLCGCSCWRWAVPILLYHGTSCAVWDFWSLLVCPLEQACGCPWLSMGWYCEFCRISTATACTFLSHVLGQLGATMPEAQAFQVGYWSRWRLSSGFVGFGGLWPSASPADLFLRWPYWRVASASPEWVCAIVGQNGRPFGGWTLPSHNGFFSMVQSMELHLSKTLACSTFSGGGPVSVWQCGRLPCWHGLETCAGTGRSSASGSNPNLRLLCWHSESLQCLAAASSVHSCKTSWPRSSYLGCLGWCVEWLRQAFCCPFVGICLARCGFSQWLPRGVRYVLRCHAAPHTNSSTNGWWPATPCFGLCHMLTIGLFCCTMWTTCAKQLTLLTVLRPCSRSTSTPRRALRGVLMLMSRKALRAQGFRVLLGARELGAHVVYTRQLANKTAVDRFKCLDDFWAKLTSTWCSFRQKLVLVTRVAWPRAMHAISAVVVGRKHFESLRTHMMQSLHLQKPGANPVLQCAWLEGLTLDPLVFAAVENFPWCTCGWVWTSGLYMTWMLALLAVMTPNSILFLRSSVNAFIKLDSPLFRMGSSLTLLVRSASWSVRLASWCSGYNLLGLQSWLSTFSTGPHSVGSKVSMWLWREKLMLGTHRMTKGFCESTCMELLSPMHMLSTGLTTVVTFALSVAPWIPHGIGFGSAQLLSTYVNPCHLTSLLQSHPFLPWWSNTVGLGARVWQLLGSNTWIHFLMMWCSNHVESCLLCWTFSLMAPVCFPPVSPCVLLRGLLSWVFLFGWTSVPWTFNRLLANHCLAWSNQPIEQSCTQSWRLSSLRPVPKKAFEFGLIAKVPWTPLPHMSGLGCPCVLIPSTVTSCLLSNALPPRIWIGMCGSA